MQRLRITCTKELPAGIQLCLAMIKNPTGEGALTQQVSCNFSKISPFRGESGFQLGLHRVTVHIVLEYLRRRKPAKVSEVLAEDLEGRASNA